MQPWKKHEKSQLPERINTRELAEDLCVLEKGCIFEYALSDGRYPLWDRSQKVLCAVLKGMAEPEVKMVDHLTFMIEVE